MYYRARLAALAALWAFALPPALTPALAEDSSVAAHRSGWQFSFTPYGWMTNVNGNATARGHTVEINESFFEIVDKSDSLLAWMSFFEARNGKSSFFTDIVWEDLGFPAHRKANFNRTVTRRPFARFSDVVVSVDANLKAKANAQAEYESLIVQSGLAYEVAKWRGAEGSVTALDLLGGIRYWNQELDVSLRVSGELTVDVTAEATIDPLDILKRDGSERTA